MSRRDQIKMTDDEVRAYIEAGRDLHMATIGPDGAPHMVTMWYGLVDGNFAVWTYGKSQKVLNLQRDPRITCLLADGDTYSTLRGVQVVGRAELLHDPEDVARIGEAVHVRNAHRFGDVEIPAPQGGTEVDEGTRDVLRVMGAKRVGIVVHPDQVVSWDHGKLGGTY